jgi:hypothetical protein
MCMRCECGGGPVEVVGASGGSVVGSVVGSVFTYFLYSIVFFFHTSACVPTRGRSGIASVGFSNVTTLWVEWPEADGRGLGILEYELSLNDVSSSSGKSTFAIKTGLLEGTSYTVKVRARNALGWGDWSEQAVLQTAAASTPDQVAQVRRAPLIGGVSNATSIAVTWDVPSSVGLVIESYSVWMDELDAAAEPTEIVPSNFFQATGLGNASIHTFQVAATNQKGTGPRSPIITLSTVFGSVPTRPAAPQVSTHPGGRFSPITSINVMWVEPYDMGLPITSYDIEILKSDGTPFYSQPSYRFFDPNPTSTLLPSIGCTASNLNCFSPNSTYTISLCARNAEGVSEWSGALVASTDPGVRPMVSHRIGSIGNVAHTAHCIAGTPCCESQLLANACPGAPWSTMRPLSHGTHVCCRRLCC